MALSCNFLARGAGTIVLALAILPLLPLPGQVVVIRHQGQTDAATGDGDCQGGNSIRYRTRLTGVETEWSDWGGTTTRTFTHLPCRAFTVEVQARVRDGRESPVTTFAFALAPPWWPPAGATNSPSRSTSPAMPPRTGSRVSSSSPSTGIGLENLRQRLRRCYPDAHTFTTTEADGWVIAVLHLGPVAIRAPRSDHA